MSASPDGSQHERGHEWIMQQARMLIAQEPSAPRLALDEVNRPMIRHWAEAMGDRNPRWAPGPDTEAPPAMAQVWTMHGLRAHRPPGDPMQAITAVLDAAGYESVLGTNCEQTYVRTLRPGERVSVTSQLSDVAGPKRTAVGEGYFVTTDSTWRVGEEVVATMRFRILKFSPAAGRVDRAQAVRPLRNRDSEYFFAGTAERELRIQQCLSCRQLRHPPGPMCPACHATDRGYVVASGRARVASYVVHHAPAVPGKQRPFPIVLVELEEGVRMVGEWRGSAEELTVGAPVQVSYERLDDDLTLAQWRPAGETDATAPEPAAPADPAPPDPERVLPPWELAITPTLVVSTALATRDFQDVHHDRDLAASHGSKDIFLNILSTTGLVQRYVFEWAGYDAQIRSCALRLGAPAYPYDTLTFTGEVTGERDGVLSIDVTGTVSLGQHVSAQLEVVAP